MILTREAFLPPALLQDVCFMGELLCTLTLVATRLRHAALAWRAYAQSQAVVMVVLHLDQVAAAHLPQRLVMAVLLVHQEKWLTHKVPALHAILDRSNLIIPAISHA